MDLGTGVREVVGIHFPQQHRALDPLGLGQLRRFSFGELKDGPTDAAGLRVPVAPPPVLDEFARAGHAFVFDTADVELRDTRRDSATFVPSPGHPSALAAGSGPGGLGIRQGLSGRTKRREGPGSVP